MFFWKKKKKNRNQDEFDELEFSENYPPKLNGFNQYNQFSQSNFLNQNYQTPYNQQNNQHQYPGYNPNQLPIGFNQQLNQQKKNQTKEYRFEDDFILEEDIEIETVPIQVSAKLILLGFLYLILFVIGVFSTTSFQGKPQIVTTYMHGQRDYYQKTYGYADALITIPVAAHKKVKEYEDMTETDKAQVQFQLGNDLNNLLELLGEIELGIKRIKPLKETVLLHDFMIELVTREKALIKKMIEYVALGKTETDLEEDINSQYETIKIRLESFKNQYNGFVDILKLNNAKKIETISE